MNRREEYFEPDAQKVKKECDEDFGPDCSVRYAIKKEELKDEVKEEVKEKSRKNLSMKRI